MSRVSTSLNGNAAFARLLASEQQRVGASVPFALTKPGTFAAIVPAGKPAAPAPLTIDVTPPEPNDVADRLDNLSNELGNSFRQLDESLGRRDRRLQREVSSFVSDVIDRSETESVDANAVDELTEIPALAPPSPAGSVANLLPISQTQASSNRTSPPVSASYGNRPIGLVLDSLI